MPRPKSSPASSRGEVATFAGMPPPVLRAAFLRHLLLGLPAGSPGAPAAEPWPVRLSGVRIHGARIEDTLDLADCAGPSGAGLPGLALENCDIAAPIDLTNARLSRLSLRDSRIGEVRARGRADRRLARCLRWRRRWPRPPGSTRTPR